MGQLGYYTHHQDANLALLQLGVRFYDPEIGRFTQRDPVAQQGTAAYPYAFGQPTARVDPDGRKAYGNVDPDEVDANYREIGRCKTACAFGMRRFAMRAVQRKYPKKNIFGDNLENAVLHCTWICMIAQYCGRDAGVTVGNNHEKYNWNPRTGAMDLANNKEGLECFDSFGGFFGSRTGNCLDCCVRKRKAGKLHLLPNEPVPEYPGGCK